MSRTKGTRERGGDGTSPPRPAAEIEALVRETGRLAGADPASLAKRLAAVPVGDQVEIALRLPARERLELLLHAPAPMALVRALPDFEAYLTVREIGPSDALPFLALASARQIVHLMDLEGWRGDRFDAARSGAWVALLLEAGETALVRFLRSADDELLVLLLARWARIEPIVPDGEEDVKGAGETEAGTERGFVSPDGHYRFRPAIPGHAAAIRRMAEVLFRDRQERYLRIAWATQSEILDEVEEEALRWRQSRIEEHGFPALEDALSVYRPPSGIEAGAETILPADADGGRAPRTALRVMGARGTLPIAVAGLDPPVREGVLFQLTSLANHLLVADAGDAGDPEAHRAAIEKAAAYVGIALEARGAREPSEAGGILARVPLKELFREGYERASSLRRTAFTLRREGWARVDPRALDLLDSPILPRVKALLGPRPLYWDPAAVAAGELREFRSLAEVEETRVALDLAGILGRIFVERLGLDVAAVLDGPPGAAGGVAKLSTVLLTALAWHVVRGEISPAPLPRELAAEFLDRVARRGSRPSEAAAAALGRFLDFLAREARPAAKEAAALRAFASACLDLLIEQCGDLPAQVPPDPRFVSCLFLAR